MVTVNFGMESPNNEEYITFKLPIMVKELAKEKHQKFLECNNFDFKN